MRARNIGLMGLGAVVVTLLTVMSCAQKDSFYANTLFSDTYYQLYAVNNYDFLWVIDNSPSMGPKRQYVHDNMGTFLSILNSRKAVDYQMSVVTVDAFGGGTIPAGTLVSSTTGLNVVKSATSADPVSDFQGIISNIQDSGTSFWEQGLIQSYAAIQNNASVFLRPGVPLAVIYMSDDDDWSCQKMADGTTACYGIQPENNPDAIMYDTGFFINFFKNLSNTGASDVSIFPVVGTSDADCSIERVGMRYQEVAKQIGGFSVTGGLCPDQIGNSINAIAQTLADRGTRFPLSQPSNGQNITVYDNSAVVPYSSTNGYIYDPTTNSIIFTGNAIPSNGDLVQILYNGNFK